MAERPKRRKYRDNPYTLKYLEEKNIYIISFRDGKGVVQKVEVSEEIYKTFDRFELDDLSELNEYDNHIEHSELFENSLETRAKDKPMLLEDLIIQESTFNELKKAINLLPEVQRRRKGITKECIQKFSSCQNKFKRNFKKFELGGYIFAD